MSSTKVTLAFIECSIYIKRRQYEYYSASIITTLRILFFCKFPCAWTPIHLEKLRIVQISYLFPKNTVLYPNMISDFELISSIGYIPNVP